MLLSRKWCFSIFQVICVVFSLEKGFKFFYGLVHVGSSNDFINGDRDYDVVGMSQLSVDKKTALRSTILMETYSLYVKCKIEAV